MTKTYKVLIFILINCFGFQIFVHGQIIENEILEQYLDQRFNNLQNVQGEIIRNQISTPLTKSSKETYIAPSLSPLEQTYSLRGGSNLKQQGYENFNNEFENYGNVVFSGTIQDEYTLGAGDSILLVLQGGVNKVYRRNINVNGLIVLDFMEPINVLGKSIGNAQKEIQAKVNEKLYETEVYLTLENIKNITVTVTGEVNKPGTYNLSQLSSVFDAIKLSNGIKKSGSLRNIKIINGNKVTSFDFYSLFFGSNTDINIKNYLVDGTVIVVPTIGKTIALAGSFSRPGIYEIKKNKLNKQSIFKFGGGLSFPGDYKISKYNLDKESFLDHDFKLDDNIDIEDGDIIFSQPLNNFEPIGIQVVGEVKNPLILNHKENNSLKSIFLKNKQSFTEKSDTFTILIKTKDPTTFSTFYKLENLADSLSGTKNISVNDGDQLYIFSKSEIKFLTSDEVLIAIKEPEIVKNYKDKYCNSIVNLASDIQYMSSEEKQNLLPSARIIKDFDLTFTKEFLKRKDNNLVNNRQFDDTNVNEIKTKKCPSLFENNPSLLLELLRNTILLEGDVKRQGIYISHEEFNPIDLIKHAGGKTDNEYIMSPNQRVVKVLSRGFKISGEVLYPGVSKIQKPIQISEIFKNSIFTEKTYPFFSIIKKQDPLSNGNKYTVFNPLLYDKDQSKLKIDNGDEIIFFSSLQLDNVINDHLTSEEEIKNTKENNRGTDILSYENDNKTKNLKASDNIDGINLNNNFNPNKNLKDSDNIDGINLNIQIKNLIKDHIVYAQGSFVSPRPIVIGGAMPANTLINYLGGRSRDAEEKTLHIIDQDGKKLKTNVIRPYQRIFIPKKNILNSSINLKGAVKEEITVGYYPEIKLSNILTNPYQMDEDHYPYFATIERTVEETSNTKLIPFSPFEIHNGSNDLILSPGDKINIYNKEMIQSYVDKLPKNQKVTNIREGIFQNLKDDKNQSLLYLISNFIIKVQGETAKSGNFLFGSKINARDLIDIAGGLTENANLNDIKIIFSSKDNNNNTISNIREASFQEINDNKIFVNPGSILRVLNTDDKFNLGFVELFGAVKQSGSFKILENDSIFEILKRAGGLKSNAFVEGLILTRDEERLREKKSILRLQKELDKSLSAAIGLQDTNEPVDTQTLIALKELSTAAMETEGLGRVVGDFSNINVLKTTKVKSGDRIVIPTQPTSITIAGEVMSPGSIIWENNRDINFYVNSAAGFTDVADKRRIFVISPNGKAKRHSALWSTRNLITKGSIIVVPRKIELSSTLGRISAITSVFYQLTLTFAGLDNLLD